MSQPGAVRRHKATVDGVHVELERTAGDRLVVVGDLQQVEPHLGRLVADRHRAVLVVLDLRVALLAGRGRNHGYRGKGQWSKQALTDCQTGVRLTIKLYIILNE